MAVRLYNIGNDKPAADNVERGGSWSRGGRCTISITGKVIGRRPHQCPLSAAYSFLNHRRCSFAYNPCSQSLGPVHIVEFYAGLAY